MVDLSLPRQRLESMGVSNNQLLISNLGGAGQRFESSPGHHFKFLFIKDNLTHPTLAAKQTLLFCRHLVTSGDELNRCIRSIRYFKVPCYTARHS